MRLTRKRWFALGTAPVLAASGLLGVTLTASAATHHAARPHGVRSPRASADTPATGSPAVFHQEFASTTKYFCPAGSGNAPCDGNSAAGDYGTIDRVASGFSNGGYGNYAPSTAAFSGNFFALTSGDEAGNQGVGCPADGGTGNESCAGPYALFPVNGEASDDWGDADVFPSGGFTVTNDLYLSPSTPPGPTGTLIDDDVELNSSTYSQQTEYYGIDNVVGVCYNSTAGGFTINFSHNTGNCDYTSGTTPVVTSDGWYRFVFVFSNVSGYAELTENVIDESTHDTVATSGPQPVNGSSATPISQWGGPGYFWLADDDVSGLPLANFALQDGQHAAGYTP